MSGYTAVLDANVLFPFHCRDLLLEFASAGFYRAKWTSDIDDEWQRNLISKGHATQENVDRVASFMHRAVRDWEILNYRRLIQVLELPDPDDRHVLAAAIVGKADCIVTNNRKDFPVSQLSPYGIETQSADSFLVNQFDLVVPKALAAVERCRKRSRNPAYSAEEYLERLKKSGLPGLSQRLEEWRSFMM